MEASFRSRLDRTFGFLNDANKNDGDSQHLWSVEERAASMKNERLSHEGDNSDDDDDDEVSGYADFLKSENAKRQGERVNSRFFGEEDLADLDSGDEDEDEDEGDDDDDDEDEEEQMRLGEKKKGGEEQTEIVEVIRARDGGGGGQLDPSKREDEDEEEREVREMVGMDDTLDFEDEEDEYDKVAVGTEGFDDRLFMSQVRNFGASRQQLNPLPTSFIEMRQASRDRRANHKAALARLEEDDRAAAAKESSQATEKSETEKSNTAEDPGSQPVRQDNGGEAMDIDGDGHKEEPMEEVRNETRQSVPGNLESSLVREGELRKPGKRVRFSMDETAGAKSDTGVPDEELSMIASPFCCIDDPPPVATPNRYRNVPDYVKNPSKYIHYTLDWSEEDEEKANMAAFHAARVVSSSSSLTQDMVTDKHEEQSQGPSGSTKISFNPLVTLSKRISKESGRGVGRGMGIDASEGVLTNGVVNVAANFDMDSNLGGLITMEDDQDFSTSSDLIGQGKSGRVVRRYRNRVTDDIETE